MRSEERLLDLMENLPDHMLEEALDIKRKMRHGGGKRIFYGIAAAACAVVLFLALVPAGQAAAAQIRESIEYLLEKWFPPKDIPVFPEGEEENAAHEIYGALPDSLLQQEESAPQETEDAVPAGFAIYVDPELFETLEDGEDYLIRKKRYIYTREEAVSGMSALLEGLSEEEAEQKIQERIEEAQNFYDSMPVCEIRITQALQTAPEDAAEKMREEFLAKYENVSEIRSSDLLEGLYLYGDEGAQWDSGIAEVYFADNGSGGVFIIEAHYFMEAAEGMGARFHSMIGSFEILPPDRMNVCP